MAEWLAIPDDSISWPEPEAMIAVANSRAAPVFLISSSGTITYANPAARRLLGDRLATQPHPMLADVLGTTVTGKLWPVINRTLTTGNDAATEISFLDHAWLGEMFPLRNPTGPPDTVALVCIDVTSLEQRTQQQIATQKELTATLMKEFRHTFKNKLQSVISLLRQHQGGDAQSADILNKAITQLLAISAVYGIKARVDEDRIYMCSIVNEVIHGVHSAHPLVPLEPLKSIKQVALTDDDAVPIALVINELVTNAAKHTRFCAQMQIRIAVETSPIQSRLRILNRPATLENAINIEHGNGLGSGLQLVRALLSATASELHITQEGDGVVAMLTLRPPTVDLSKAAFDEN